MINRKVQKSRARRSGETEKNETLPPFVADLSRTSKFASSPQNSAPKTDSDQKSRTNRNVADVAGEKSTRDFTRLKMIFARIFQNLAYVCLSLGIAAVLAVIVAAVMIYWPRPESSGGVVTDPGDFSGGGWMWLMIGGVAPGFVIFFQIFIGVVGLILVIWLWRKVVQATRKLVWRIADEIMKPLSLVEPVLMLILWTIGVVGAWWLADAELFVSLAVICLIFLAVGLVSLAPMRKLSGRSLDFVRADLAGR